MTENRFKARQQKRAVEEESRLEQAKGGTTSVSAKNHGRTDSEQMRKLISNHADKGEIRGAALVFPGRNRTDSLIDRSKT